jgi:hypothetical protein
MKQSPKTVEFGEFSHNAPRILSVTIYGKTAGLLVKANGGIFGVTTTKTSARNLIRFSK